MKVLVIDALEAVKLFGGIAGLLSAAFLIFDRLVRDRPILVLHRQSIGVNGYAYLRIINRVDDDLIIQSVTCRPPHISIATDHGVRAIAEAVIQSPLGPLIISPKSEAHLPIVKMSQTETSSQAQVRITIRWRRSHHAWPCDRATTLKTDIKFITTLEEAKPVGNAGVEHRS